MMRLARKQGMSKFYAQAWVYTELDLLYASLGTGDNEPQKATLSPSTDPQKATLSLSPSSVETGGPGQAAGRGSNPTMSGADGQIQGLDDIPEGWPDLPANASLSSGWGGTPGPASQLGPMTGGSRAMTCQGTRRPPTA